MSDSALHSLEQQVILQGEDGRDLKDDVDVNLLCYRLAFLRTGSLDASGAYTELEFIGGYTCSILEESWDNYKMPSGLMTVLRWV